MLTPDFRGTLETDDGATILFEWHGLTNARHELTGAITHLSDDERYRWLNDVVCVGVGEIRPRTGGGPRQVVGHDVEFVVEVSELVWEPLAD